jgi:hypothetical protein
LGWHEGGGENNPEGAGQLAQVLQVLPKDGKGAAGFAVEIGDETVELFEQNEGVIGGGAEGFEGVDFAIDVVVKVEKGAIAGYPAEEVGAVVDAVGGFLVGEFCELGIGGVIPSQNVGAIAIFRVP